MKKFLLIVAFVLGSLNLGYADYNGVTFLSYTNLCQQVDRYNVMNIKFFQFVKLDGSSTYLRDYNGAYYAVTTVMVGYKDMVTQRAFYNSTEIGTNTEYFECPGSYSNQTNNTFRAGRVTHWLIPKSVFNGGGTVTVTIEGRTISTSNL